MEDVASEFDSHPQIHEILDFIRAVATGRCASPRPSIDGRRGPDRPLRIALVAGRILWRSNWARV